jgi:hypothetical protein
MNYLVALIAVLSMSCGGSASTPQGKPSASGVSEQVALPSVPAELLASPQPDAERVSLARVLATPEALHGKPVKLGGFAHVEFEGSYLCLHRDDVQYRIVTNCIWLDVPLRPETEAVNDQYVAVVGVIDAKSRGHMGMFQAAVTEVSQLAVLPTRAQLAKDRSVENR